MTHRAEILAAAAIACACHQLRIPLPSISKEGSPSPTMEEGEEREPEVHWLDQLHVSESELAGSYS